MYRMISMMADVSSRDSTATERPTVFPTVFVVDDDVSVRVSSF